MEPEYQQRVKEEKRAGGQIPVSRENQRLRRKPFPGGAGKGFERG
jgi:hypothetical protein